MKRLSIIVITAVLSLLIMAGVSSVASSDGTGTIILTGTETTTLTAGHTHTLTVNGGTTATFTAGSTVRDTVTSDSISGTRMIFDWRNDGALLQTSDRPRDVNYNDSRTAITTGNWIIDVNETNTTGQSLGTSFTTFTVSPQPEFGKLGVVLPLFTIGILYLSLRKRYL